ncbi:hypothetical protein [uncultured Roseibium sp.]|uniref:serine hydrolase domain-containing protein n=1 Tax=uncultured Roseibium sp. TaxID=1936171 RepID=UPI00321801C0
MRSSRSNPDLMEQPGRDRILVGHALSMQMGLEWNEDLPYSDPRNSEIAMERATDRYRYVLEQPIREAPGQSWIYSGGATALIGKLIRKRHGPAAGYLREGKAVRPSGNRRHLNGLLVRMGSPRPHSGLRLTLPDLVKIGQVIADGGDYGGRQLVPADWLKRSFEPRVKIKRFHQIRIPLVSRGQRRSHHRDRRRKWRPEADRAAGPRLGGCVLCRPLQTTPRAGRTSLKVVLEFAVPEAKRLLGK